MNSCFIAGLKGKTQDVFCKRPPTSFALDNCSCIVLLPSIHGHIRVPEFSGIAYEPALMRRPGAQGPRIIIMVALPGEFALPIPENSANERGGVKARKEKINPTAQTKAYFEILKLECCTVFDFDAQSTSASHLASIVIMGLLCQLSERFLRVDVHGCTNVASAGSARATWLSVIMILAKWGPRVFYGA